MRILCCIVRHRVALGMRIHYYYPCVCACTFNISNHVIRLVAQGVCEGRESGGEGRATRYTIMYTARLEVRHNRTWVCAPWRRWLVVLRCEYRYRVIFQTSTCVYVYMYFWILFSNRLQRYAYSVLINMEANSKTDIRAIHTWRSAVASSN